MATNIFTIVKLTVLDFLLPTADTYGDINFAVGAFSTKNYQIGCLMASPVILNLLFMCYIWKTTDLDSPREKRFTWFLVLLNVWPQYHVLKLIMLIIRQKPKDTWERKQKAINVHLLSVEPYIEAIPQYFFSTGLIATLGTRFIFRKLTEI